MIYPGPVYSVGNPIPHENRSQECCWRIRMQTSWTPVRPVRPPFWEQIYQIKMNYLNNDLHGPLKIYSGKYLDQLLEFFWFIFSINSCCHRSHNWPQLWNSFFATMPRSSLEQVALLKAIWLGRMTCILIWALTQRSSNQTFLSDFWAPEPFWWDSNPWECFKIV